MSNCTKNAALGMLALLLGLFCSSCTKSMAVPSDCRAFLDEFFGAVKSNDAGKIHALSLPARNLESNSDVAGAPPQAVEQMREVGLNMDRTQLEKMKKMFGAFESYSVVSVKVNPLTAADLTIPEPPDAADLSGGSHAVIVCKAKFSNASGRFSFDLVKKAQDPGYLFQAYRFEAE